MSQTTAEHAIALVRLDWSVSDKRVAAFRSKDMLLCNARFPDRQLEDLFSAVLRWPSDDPSEGLFSLMVPTRAMRPVGSRLQPGQRIVVTEGPVQVLAEAEVVRLVE